MTKPMPTIFVTAPPPVLAVVEGPVDVGVSVLSVDTQKSRDFRREANREGRIENCTLMSK